MPYVAAQHEVTWIHTFMTFMDNLQMYTNVTLYFTAYPTAHCGTSHITVHTTLIV